MRGLVGIFGVRGLAANRAGFSLVEVAMALGLSAFVLLALVGLTGRAFQSSAESVKTIEAASAASQVVGRWRAMVAWNSDPSSTELATQPAGFPLPVNIPNVGETLEDTGLGIDSEGNQASTAEAFQLRYRIERSVYQPELLQLHLVLTWPPGASEAEATGNYEVFTSGRIRE